MTILDPIDRSLIKATEAGLPLTEHPYGRISEQLGLSEREIIDRLADLKARGIMRRIALAPNHYTLGMTANGMTVWDIDDDQITELGRSIGALPYVTHCYRRPRALPMWPYNLFAMVHGSGRAEVELKRRQIAALLGPACRASDVLYSKRILKKTGLRLTSKEG